MERALLGIGFVPGGVALLVIAECRTPLGLTGVAFVTDGLTGLGLLTVDFAEVAAMMMTGMRYERKIQR